MTRPTFKESSRKEWHSAGERPSREDINAGSLQRIADACELMCKDRESLERRLNHAMQSNAHNIRRANSLERSNAGLRGAITRLKRERDELRARIGRLVENDGNARC